MSDGRGRIEGAPDGPDRSDHADTGRLPGYSHDWLSRCLVVGVVLDVVTTSLGVPRAEIAETNPLVAGAFTAVGWPAFPLTYLVVGLVLAGLFRAVTVPRRWLRRFGWVAVAVLTATVCNNLFVLAAHW